MISHPHHSLAWLQHRMFLRVHPTLPVKDAQTQLNSHILATRQQRHLFPRQFTVVCWAPLLVLVQIGSRTLRTDGNVQASGYCCQNYRPSFFVQGQEVTGVCLMLAEWDDLANTHALSDNLTGSSGNNRSQTLTHSNLYNQLVDAC